MKKEESEEIAKKSLDDMMKIGYAMNINGVIFVEVSMLDGVPGTITRGMRDTERLSNKK